MAVIAMKLCSTIKSIDDEAERFNRRGAECAEDIF